MVLSIHPVVSIYQQPIPRYRVTILLSSHSRVLVHITTILWMPRDGVSGYASTLSTCPGDAMHPATCCGKEQHTNTLRVWVMRYTTQRMWCSEEVQVQHECCKYSTCGTASTVPVVLQAGYCYSSGIPVCMSTCTMYTCLLVYLHEVRDYAREVKHSFPCMPAYT